MLIRYPAVNAEALKQSSNDRNVADRTSQKLMSSLITPEDFIDLPGEDLIRQGLNDAAVGRESIGVLLIQIGATRLRLLGVNVPAKRIDQSRR